MIQINLTKDIYDQLLQLDINCDFIKIVKMANPKMIPCVVLMSDEVFGKLSKQVLNIINQ